MSGSQRKKTWNESFWHMPVIKIIKNVIFRVLSYVSALSRPKLGQLRVDLAPQRLPAAPLGLCPTQTLVGSHLSCLDFWCKLDLTVSELHSPYGGSVRR